MPNFSRKGWKPPENAPPRRPPAPDRVLGPYPEGSRWRVVQIIDGKRTARTATTRDKAVQIAQQLRQRLVLAPSRSLAAALREYDAHLRLERRLSPASCVHARRTLSTFLADPQVPLSALTVARAHKLARFEHAQTHRIRRRYALSTRRAVLGHATRFFQWAKSRRYIERNPFDGVRPIGRGPAGPAPLSLDQARTLAAVALHQASHDPGALGVVLILVLGLRSADVLPLRVGDIDPEVQRLRIAGPQGSPRTIPIPELLRPCLRAALAGKTSEMLFLGAGRTGRTRPHNFLWRALQRLCRQAQVSPTCPRSLRSLYRKLAQTARRSTMRIAAASPPCAAAARSPATEVPTHSAAWVRVIDLLGLSPSRTGHGLDATLSALSPSALAQQHPPLHGYAPHGAPSIP